MGLHDTLNCAKWAPLTRNDARLQRTLARERLRVLSDQVLLDDLAVARNEVNSGRYSYSIKL